MYVLFTIIVILLIVIILEFNRKKYSKWKRNLQFAISLPGAPILLSIVNSLRIACNYEMLIDHVKAFTIRYETPSRLILGTDIFIVLDKPNDYKLVLSNVNGNYKSSVTKLWQVFLGNGIIGLSGSVHRLRRKIIQPFLNIKCLFEYVPFFDNYSNFYADIFEKEIGGHAFDIKPQIARCVIDIFLASFAGIQGKAIKGEYDHLLYSQEKLVKLVYSRMVKPWLQLEWFFSLRNDAKIMSANQKVLQDFINSITSREHNDLEDDTEILQRPKSVISNYMGCLEQPLNNITNKSYELSSNDIFDDSCSLYVAMQNTITESICFIMLMLGMHNEIQEKLREEIFSTFGNDNVDAQRLRSMRYLHMVIHETLRLFPVVPIILRQLTGDIQIDSCILPDGSYVMIPIYAIHRNPKYWHNPEKFIPERFSPENSSSHHRYAYIPFGTGPRDCLGQRYVFLSIGTIVVNLVRRLRFVSTIEDIKLTNDIIMRNQGGARLSVFRV